MQQQRREVAAGDHARTAPERRASPLLQNETRPRSSLRRRRLTTKHPHRYQGLLPSSITPVSYSHSHLRRAELLFIILPSMSFDIDELNVSRVILTPLGVFRHCEQGDVDCTLPVTGAVTEPTVPPCSSDCILALCNRAIASHEPRAVGDSIPTAIRCRDAASTAAGEKNVTTESLHRLRCVNGDC